MLKKIATILAAALALASFSASGAQTMGLTSLARDMPLTGKALSRDAVSPALPARFGWA